MLLNKVDLVTGGAMEVEDLEGQIHNINGLVKIVRSERCQVDLKDIFERGAYKAQVHCQFLGELLPFSNLFFLLLGEL